MMLWGDFCNTYHVEWPFLSSLFPSLPTVHTKTHRWSMSTTNPHSVNSRMEISPTNQVKTKDPRTSSPTPHYPNSTTKTYSRYVPSSPKPYRNNQSPWFTFVTTNPVWRCAHAYSSPHRSFSNPNHPHGQHNIGKSIKLKPDHIQEIVQMTW